MATRSLLETVPSEVLLNIVTRLPDLVSLDSLIRASPAAFRLFNDFAVEITECVLAAGFTHGYIRLIIRIIALIRSSILPIPDLLSFQERVTKAVMKRGIELFIHNCGPGGPEEAMENEIRMAEEEDGPTPTTEALAHRLGLFDDAFAPTHLDWDVSAAVLRSILASARSNTCLALDCLEASLARFRALTPQHPVDETIAFGKSDIPMSERRIEGRPCEVYDVGPPSWSEEQRAMRACWRPQVFYDLQKAATHSMLNWPPEDLE